MPLTRNPGRAIGWMYLSITLLGIFALMYPSRLFVPGDPAATASRMLANETLYRLTIVAGLVSSVVFIFLGRALYRLFRDVDPAQATLMLTLIVMMLTIGIALTANDLAAITVLRGTDILHAFTEAQRQGLAMMLWRAGSQGTLIAEIFWGLWLFPLGVLVMRSGFVPRILGVLLILNGVAYLVASFTGMLLPTYGKLVNQWARIPETGELWFTLWLLIRGARAPEPARTAESVATV